VSLRPISENYPSWKVTNVYRYALEVSKVVVTASLGTHADKCLLRDSYILT